MAFNIKDANGTLIQMQDKVNAKVLPSLDLGPELAGKEEIFAIVIEILSETEIKCMPVEEGLPFTTQPENVTVVSSIVADILDVTKNSDFKSIMANAELRLDQFKAAKVTKRSPKSGGKKRTDLEAQIKVELL